jgi:TonB family protein
VTARRFPIPRIRVRWSRGRIDSPAGFLFFSLVAHVSGFCLVAAASSRMGGFAPPPPDPGFTVELASLPPAGSLDAGSPPAAAASRTAPSPEPPAKPVVTLPANPRKTVEVVKPAAPPPKPDTAKTPTPAPIGGNPPPGGASPAEANPAGPVNPSATGAPGTPGVEGGVGSLDEPGSPQASYVGRVVARLKAVWVRPVLPDAAVRRVIVTFTLQTDGSVRDVAVEVPSDYEPLDRSALGAVASAVPFPPFPRQWQIASLSQRIVFELTP